MTGTPSHDRLKERRNLSQGPERNDSRPEELSRSTGRQIVGGKENNDAMMISLVDYL